MLSFLLNIATLFSVTRILVGAEDALPPCQNGTDTAPSPEPIEVIELPLPPSIDNTTEGACTLDINPRGTGCIATTGLQSGTFFPDGNHVAATATFIGSPAGSIYNGSHIIILKADGTTFPNGDTWKCITCGATASLSDASYPQTFRDGVRALVGSSVIDCGTAPLISEACAPSNISIYPMYLDSGANSSLALREIRLHPDNVHITANVFTFSTGQIGELTIFSRIQFNASSARYDLVNTTLLNGPAASPTIYTVGDQLVLNRSAPSVGELRGLTGTGAEITYVGYSWSSCNIDVFAADLASGRVRRLTAHPEYADPVAFSPDDGWQVVMDTRGSGRMMFLSGLTSVPPLVDTVVTAAVGSVRNNGVRRFFQPYLLDGRGDRPGEGYFGQQINKEGNGSAGAVNDPNWNGGADPRWSLDGTKVVYYQWLASPPACGGENPLACETSPYEDGRRERVMVATFTSREPLPVEDVPEPASADVPWAEKYMPGTVKTPGLGMSISTGNYTLFGECGGHADVSIVLGEGGYVQSVAVVYENYSYDGLSFVNGWENVTATPVNITLSRLDWFSDIVSTGLVNGTKVTSLDGFHLEIDDINSIFEANGTLTTTVDGVAWYQPCNGC